MSLICRSTKWICPLMPKNFLSVRGVPKYEIIIFDVETGLRLHGHNSAVPLLNDYFKA